LIGVSSIILNKAKIRTTHARPGPMRSFWSIKSYNCPYACRSQRHYDFLFNASRVSQNILWCGFPTEQGLGFAPNFGFGIARDNQDILHG